ncbi:adenosine 3'-phospho 5'-phosphosulfate transporter 1-like isoform X2 [Lineus longissimus]|uniref:adenosine 3'-phospho 5'-phosphosulfate transporter 1-like isoform X2 n=1 Tax=Lineus longissimus TaxID=88925 RepID=UPI002B4F4E94
MSSQTSGHSQFHTRRRKAAAASPIVRALVQQMHYRIMAGLCVTLLFILVPVYITGTDHPAEDDTTTSHAAWADFWLFRIVLNLLGYATVFVPAALVIQYLRKNKYNEKAGYGIIPRVIRMCVFGSEDDQSVVEEGGVTSTPVTPPKKERTDLHNALLLCFCFFGLQGSYLTWGVLQERIMTHEYGLTETNKIGVRFKNSQFLVFMNRILALFIACVVILLRRQPRHKAPLYRYSYASFSNIMSSWFQYEALKFVSFPTQVLAKASKIIPVMLMGKIVSGKSYDWYEYFTALMISAGVGMFLLTNSENKHSETVTTVSGIILLVGYMVFDSFTSNWQGELFRQYKMSSIQAMAGVNLFSCLFTVTSLLEQGGFVDSVQFMLMYPSFMLHVCLLSVCSATGQLFIFFTISQFGAVTFIIIMTMRQAFAILLSCVIYSHPVSIIGGVGIFVVFLAMSLKIYLGQRKKKIQKSPAALNGSGNNTKV